jgi:hypothetical protein
MTVDRKNNTWQRMFNNLAEWTNKTELEPEVEEDLERLKELHEHLAHAKHAQAGEDLIDRAHEESAWRERQKEHQARNYWQYGYHDERPKELIENQEIPEPVYRAKELRDAKRYCLTPSKLTPLDKGSS